MLCMRIWVHNGAQSSQACPKCALQHTSPCADCYRPYPCFGWRVRAAGVLAKMKLQVCRSRESEFVVDPSDMTKTYIRYMTPVPNTSFHCREAHTRGSCQRSAQGIFSTKPATNVSNADLNVPGESNISGMTFCLPRGKKYQKTDQTGAHVLPNPRVLQKQGSVP